MNADLEKEKAGVTPECLQFAVPQRHKEMHKPFICEVIVAQVQFSQLGGPDAIWKFFTAGHSEMTCIQPAAEKES